MKQSYGHIEVQSALGRGSSFQVYLPAEAQAATALEPGKDGAEPAFSGETILVVEDAAPLRDLVCQALSVSGCNVLSAPEAEEALRILGQQKGMIHLLITDVIMPGMNGPALAKQVRAMRPETKILYMTGYSGEFVRSDMSRFPACLSFRNLSHRLIFAAKFAKCCPTSQPRKPPPPAKCRRECPARAAAPRTPLHERDARAHIGPPLRGPRKIPVYFAHPTAGERAMLKIQLLLAATILSFASLATADTVVLRDGTSYLGHLQGGAITFADTQGVKYEFPGPDVQSLVFSSSGDVVTLRNGKSYSGHFTGSDPVAFSDAQGIHYQFPVSDLDAIIFNHAGAAPPPSGAKMIPSGSDLLRPDQ